LPGNEFSHPRCAYINSSPTFWRCYRDSAAVIAAAAAAAAAAAVAAAVVVKVFPSSNAADF